MNAGKRERPAAVTDEALNVQAAARTNTIIAADPAIDRTLAAVVITGSEIPRRRVYLGLRSAEEAMRRARNAGIPARVVLCELLPLAGDP